MYEQNICFFMHFFSVFLHTGFFDAISQNLHKNVWMETWLVRAPLFPPPANRASISELS